MNAAPKRMSKVEQLMSAAKSGEVDAVKQLLTQKPGWISRILGRRITVRTRDAAQNQPLHHAAAGGHVDVVSFLLDSGAAISASNWHRDTPLHMAAIKGDMAIVRLLLKRGADWNARNKDGEVPLVSALEEGHFDIAEELLSASGNAALPNGKDSFLLRERVLRRPDAVRWVLQHGASPNVVDENGNTPLHILAGPVFCAKAVAIAVLEGNLDPVETLCVLLEAGADVRGLKNAAGQSPLDVARTTSAKLAEVGVMAAGSPHYGAQTAEGSRRLLQVVQLIQSILEACTTSPSPQEFASEAVRRTTRRQVPFFMIAPIVRAVMEALRAKYPGVPVSHLVQQSTQAFGFACPNCGPLNAQLIYLAVAAKWAQEKMKPQGLTVFAGPNVAAVFRGWCPQCFSTSVEASFDPTKLARPSCP